MSHDGELSRIFEKDLTLSKNYLQSAYQNDVGRLEAENERLVKENQALWQSINAYKENTSLRAASVISYILSWSERKNNSNIQDVQMRKNVEPTSDTRTDPASPFRPILIAPEINVQAPSKNPSYTDQAKSFQQITSRSPSKFIEDVDTRPSYCNPQQSAASASRTKSPGPPSFDMLKNQIPVSVNPSMRMRSTESSPAPSVSGRENKPMKTTQLPFSNEHYAPDENDWNGMIRKSPLPQGIQINTPAQKLVPDQTITDRKTGKSGIILPNIPEYNKTGSEGYGSQIVNESMATQLANQSIGKRLVGEPIASSTPKSSRDVPSVSKRGTGQQVSQSSVRPQQSGSSIIHRPIDQVIGFIPILSETRRQKLAQIKPSKRLIGEIAFQLDRRILNFVFDGDEKEPSRRKRYYGYSIANIGQMIRREAVDVTGQYDVNKELEMRYRFDLIMRTLTKYGYSLEKHSSFSQDMVNKYGLLSGPPDVKTVKVFGLEDPLILRILVSQLIKDYEELEEELILLDCLCLLAFDDKKPIFSW